MHKVFAVRIYFIDELERIREPDETIEEVAKTAAVIRFLHTRRDTAEKRAKELNAQAMVEYGNPTRWIVTEETVEL